ncbi:uncharacterized protein EHS24_007578 [Apiotrichum porosum]|uniref:Uncharacterized protein n=1 Tax=Apiotrichum porosum TaxID=105984 RepID=A0A427XUR3_9TREE|nr:uncharacterized protein EHS24_007578 [Apiotrichum porosum]RSH82594.1 hypothetical protein EHS24_007578 [Apiotrichum porosum]
MPSPVHRFFNAWLGVPTLTAWLAIEHLPWWGVSKAEMVNTVIANADVMPPVVADIIELNRADPAAAARRAAGAQARRNAILGARLNDLEAENAGLRAEAAALRADIAPQAGDAERVRHLFNDVEVLRRAAEADQGRLDDVEVEAGVQRTEMRALARLGNEQQRRVANLEAEAAMQRAEVADHRQAARDNEDRMRALEAEIADLRQAADANNRARNLARAARPRAHPYFVDPVDPAISGVKRARKRTANFALARKAYENEY